MKNIQTYLLRELKEYEACTPMNEDERKALHEWVEKGHSLHTNPYDGVYEGGYPMDFLDAYRDMEEMENEFRAMSSEEQERFIREYRGEETIEDLRLKISELESKINVYEWVLGKYHLMKEAMNEVKEAHRRSEEFASRMSTEEVPF